MTNVERLIRKRLLKSGEVFEMPLNHEDGLKVLQKFVRRKLKEENPNIK